ncbi:hypothetical protein B566_EDAN006055 [Ephemera danica]|nr:hypothetical protein B566_EDAN006055 [Ephemera danica]
MPLNVLFGLLLLNVSLGLSEVIGTQEHEEAARYDQVTEKSSSIIKSHHDSDTRRFINPAHSFNDKFQLLHARMIKELDPVQQERRVHFMNSLAVPGTSGSYAYTNIFRMYGKMVNYAISVSFAPLGPVNFPALASPALIVSSDDPTNSTQEITNVFNSTKFNDQSNKGTRFPPYFPYPNYPFFLPPYNNFIPNGIRNKVENKTITEMRKL